MNASSQAVAVAPPPFAALIDHEVLTRVSLAYVAHRFNLYLRFGEPAYHVQRDRWRRVAAFWPASIFCRIRWEANDYGTVRRSEEHTSELQSLMRISYAVFCLKKKNYNTTPKLDETTLCNLQSDTIT